MSAPADALAPVGWTCARDDPREVVFQHEDLPSVVRAVRTDADEDLWRVELLEHAGEAESARTVGYAATRDRALDALTASMSAMNRVHDRTGTVRAMMASTLALHDDVGVRGGGVRDVSSAWRTADRPFASYLAAENPRTPWRRADEARSDADADGAGTDADAEADVDGDGSDDADGDA